MTFVARLPQRIVDVTALQEQALVVALTRSIETLPASMDTRARLPQAIVNALRSIGVLMVYEAIYMGTFCLSSATGIDAASLQTVRTALQDHGMQSGFDLHMDQIIPWDILERCDQMRLVAYPDIAMPLTRRMLERPWCDWTTRRPSHQSRLALREAIEQNGFRLAGDLLGTYAQMPTVTDFPWLRRLEGAWCQNELQYLWRRLTPWGYDRPTPAVRMQFRAMRDDAIASQPLRTPPP